MQPSLFGCMNDVWKGQIFLSGMYVARDVNTLREKGITHVLCVAREAYTRHPAEMAGDLELARFDGMLLDDFGSSSLAKLLPPHIGFIDKALSSPGGRCLVHCKMGVNRSAAVVIAYLMARAGMTYKEAHLHTLRHRPIICLHDSYKAQLEALPSDFGDLVPLVPHEALDKASLEAAPTGPVVRPSSRVHRPSTCCGASACVTQ
mmetsp:Transcript_14354/g.26623  ORF Transcript_14354/g.26623 Transcript_14354/m.26623 type:complete len:204 (+) Transcript_14354:116-727(+)